MNKKANRKRSGSKKSRGLDLCLQFTAEIHVGRLFRGRPTPLTGSAQYILEEAFLHFDSTLFREIADFMDAAKARSHDDSGYLDSRELTALYVACCGMHKARDAEWFEPYGKKFPQLRTPFNTEPYRPQPAEIERFLRNVNGSQTDRRVIRRWLRALS